MVKAGMVFALAMVSLLVPASAQHSYAGRDWSQEDWAIACEGKADGAACEFVTNQTTKCLNPTSELKWCWEAEETGATRVSVCEFWDGGNVSGCFTDDNTRPAYMACAGRGAGSACMITRRGTNHTGKCFNHEYHGAFMCLESIGPDDECEGKMAGAQCEEDVGSYDREASPYAVCQHSTSRGTMRCGAADYLWEAKYLPCIGRVGGASCGYFEDEVWTTGVCKTGSSNISCGEEELMSSAMNTLGSASAIVVGLLANFM